MTQLKGLIPSHIMFERQESRREQQEGINEETIRIEGDKRDKANGKIHRIRQTWRGSCFINIHKVDGDKSIKPARCGCETRRSCLQLDIVTGDVIRNHIYIIRKSELVWVVLTEEIRTAYEGRHLSVGGVAKKPKHKTDSVLVLINCDKFWIL